MRNVIGTLIIIVVSVVGVAAWQAWQDNPDTVVESTIDNLVDYGATLAEALGASGEDAEGAG